MAYKLKRPDKAKTEQPARLKKALMMAKEIGLSDEQRYELARMVPTIEEEHDGSWRKLNETQLHDLLTMIEGWIWISYLKSQER